MTQITSKNLVFIFYGWMERTNKKILGIQKSWDLILQWQNIPLFCWYNILTKNWIKKSINFTFVQILIYEPKTDVIAHRYLFSEEKKIGKQTNRGTKKNHEFLDSIVTRKQLKRGTMNLLTAKLCISFQWCTFFNSCSLYCSPAVCVRPKSNNMRIEQNAIKKREREKKVNCKVEIVCEWRWKTSKPNKHTHTHILLREQKGKERKIE